MGRRWLGAESAADLGRLDADAIARVRAEAWPDPANPDELHDALVWLGFLTEAEVHAEPGWSEFLATLAHDKRIAQLQLPGASIWIAAERLPQFQARWRKPRVDPAIAAPAAYAGEKWSADTALIEIVRGRLEGLGPSTQNALAASLSLEPEEVAGALAALELEGFALRGRFTPGIAEEEWCERRLLARMHSY